MIDRKSQNSFTYWLYRKSLCKLSNLTVWVCLLFAYMNYRTMDLFLATVACESVHVKSTNFQKNCCSKIFDFAEAYSNERLIYLSDKSKFVWANNHRLIVGKAFIGVGVLILMCNFYLEQFWQHPKVLIMGPNAPRMSLYIKQSIIKGIKYISRFRLPQSLYAWLKKSGKTLVTQHKVGSKWLIYTNLHRL